jgi:hypothetical protein
MNSLKLSIAMSATGRLVRELSEEWTTAFKTSNDVYRARVLERILRLSNMDVIAAYTWILRGAVNCTCPECSSMLIIASSDINSIDNLRASLESETTSSIARA